MTALKANEPKWTSGEWRHYGPTGAVKRVSDCKLIASVFGDDEDCHEDERQVANCNLIAAAPELYEALEFAERCISVMETEDFPYYAGCIAKCRAALARARGETP